MTFCCVLYGESVTWPTVEKFIDSLLCINHILYLVCYCTYNVQTVHIAFLVSAVYAAFSTY